MGKGQSRKTNRRVRTPATKLAHLRKKAAKAYDPGAIRKTKKTP